MNLTHIQPRAGGRTLELTGAMVIDDAGNFTINLAGGGNAPPEPEPEPPPEDIITITPTGGDDTGAIQRALNELPTGYALMLSGTFSISNTLWLDGTEKTVMADPGKPSGFRPSKAGFSGHYGALLCTTPDTARCRILGLEFDGDSLPVEMVFFDGGQDNSIEGCYLHDIMYDPAGPPFAAIHSQSTVNLRVLNNRVERTSGVDGGQGVRGIWVPGTKGTVCVRNNVKDTGHTCISVEGANAVITDNVVENSLVQGTGMKICYRGAGVYRRRSVPKTAPPVMLFARNQIRGTVGGGLMLENCASVAVLVTQCVFADCGREGTTFGGLYSSSYTNGLRVVDNQFERCRSVGAFRMLNTSALENNTIHDGSNVIYLEDDCHQITVTNSGTVNLGSNCSGVTVDGKVIA